MPGSTSSVVLKRDVIDDHDCNCVEEAVEAASDFFVGLDSEWMSRDVNDGEGEQAARRPASTNADVCLVNVQSAVVAMGAAYLRKCMTFDLIDDLTSSLQYGKAWAWIYLRLY